MINPDPILCGRAAKVGKTLTRFLSATLNRHWGYVYFTFAYFMLHVSFLCLNLLIINTFKAETYDFYVSLLVSMFHTKNTEGEKQKHCGSDSKTLRERESAPSVF